MKADDGRMRLAKRWTRLADLHGHAALICCQIATKEREGRPTLGLRNRLRTVERDCDQYLRKLLSSIEGQQYLLRADLLGGFDGRRGSRPSSRPRRPK